MIRGTCLTTAATPGMRNARDDRQRQEKQTRPLHILKGKRIQCLPSTIYTFGRSLLWEIFYSELPVSWGLPNNLRWISSMGFSVNSNLGNQRSTSRSLCWIAEKDFVLAFTHLFLLPSLLWFVIHSDTKGPHSGNAVGLIFLNVLYFKMTSSYTVLPYLLTSLN